MPFYFLAIIYKYVLYYWSKKKTQSRVIHKSVNFVLIDKAYDLKINSNNKHEKTLQTAIREQFPEMVSKKLHHEFYFLHRLDYATSGLICIPVHKKACQVASKAFQIRTCKKYYLALVRGFLSTEFLNLNYNIGRDSTHKEIEKMIVVDIGKIKEKSQTVIVALEKGLYNKYPATKILIRPITGRRHQIRVHCSHIGHTIIGDFTYSNRRDVEPFRMFLHSLKLVIPNQIEDINCETDDPFCRRKIPNWKPEIQINSLEEGFKKIDEFVHKIKQ